MAQNLVLERIDVNNVSEKILQEWRELLPNSTRPSIYATFDYIDTSLKHFSDNENVDIFYLLMRDPDSEQLYAIFPLSVQSRKCFKRRVRVLQHAITTHNSDVDKPYPIIHSDYESDCWKNFSRYFKSEYTAWDWLEYTELIPESRLNQLLKKLFAFPSYWARQLKGPVSPILDLQQTLANLLAKTSESAKKISTN